MDPFTAVSLASNVIQFVDFSCRLVSKGQQIYKSANGVLVEYLETENVAKDLNILSNNLRRSFDAGPFDDPLDDADRSLLDLYEKCEDLAGELQIKVNKLKVSGKHRKWKSTRQALKSVSGQDGIEQIASRLAIYRDEINLNITVLLR